MTLASDEEVRAFCAARAGTDRTACDRWAKAQGGDFESAKARWRAMPLLGDPALRVLSLRALATARGAVVGGATPFPSMVWYGGATDTRAGYQFTGTIADFVEHVLIARSREVAEKRCGWVVTPTTCSDGHRTNASTTAVHALNLDVDARGTWDKILAALADLGFAYIAYQSGGYALSTPKWHLLLPLTRPFDTGTPEKIDAWVSFYNSARVALGSVAELLGEGFDPTVAAPSVPVFVTERRKPEDPLRQVVWRPGCALDASALVAALPVPQEPTVVRLPQEPRVVVARTLDDERLEAVVAALCEPMSKILSDRRELYLALPGALLDRGVSADDVRAIIEEISLRCPGDPSYTRHEVSEKHREHLHCAETTIGRHERGETYSRIGTIVERWSSVALAIDAALPDDAAREEVLRYLRPRPARGVTRPRTPDTEPVAVVDVAALRDSLVRLRARKRRSDDWDENLRGVILGALLDGEDLVPRMPGETGDAALVKDGGGRIVDRESAVATAMRMVAYKLPAGTPYAAVAEIARRSLAVMSSPDCTYESLAKLAEGAFLRALGHKVRQNAARSEKVASARLAKAL